MKRLHNLEDHIPIIDPFIHYAPYENHTHGDAICRLF
jgi:hypothetical protein